MEEQVNKDKLTKTLEHGMTFATWVALGIIVYTAYFKEPEVIRGYDISLKETESEQVIDEDFLPILKEFEDDCNEHNWSINTLKNRVLSIKYGELEEGQLGWTKTFFCEENKNYYYRIVVDKSLKDEFMLKHVLYHEIGHAYGIKHSDRYFSLMYEGVKTDVVSTGLYAIYWNYTKDNFFSMNNNYPYEEFENHTFEYIIPKIDEIVSKIDTTTNQGVVQVNLLKHYKSEISHKENLKRSYY